MKKVTTLALVAMLAIAGAAFAGERFAGIEANATFANGLLPVTTNNDDSCDISVAPAATLLLPYFEVDVTRANGEKTLFAITNTSRFPQIAHVTVWTDWSFPILDFNIFLTGYDVQTIDMYDIIVRGIVAPPDGTRLTTARGTELGVRDNATRSAAIADRPGAGLAPLSTTCPNLPGELPRVLVDAVRSALTTGLYPLPTTASGCGTSGARVGSQHANAIGYVTIDVIDDPCSVELPTDYTYFQRTILFDNVLTGDYFQVDGDTQVGNYAQGNPLVHIRAIPEGGPTGDFPTNLPFTFYDRYTEENRPAAGTRTIDRRQPLPSTFAARWIEGGTGTFSTDYKIWREGVTLGTQACANAVRNSALPIRDVVRFDERENWAVVTSGDTRPCSPFCETPTYGLPETSRTATAGNANIFPARFGSDVGGWMYLNLHNNAAAAVGYSGGAARASQNWVITSMRADGRYAVDFDATWLGNGCSGPAAVSSATANHIGPRPNTTPLP